MGTLSDKQIEQYASLLENRIKEIEGNWEKPWISTEKGNAQNLDGRNYTRLNALLLNMYSLMKGYELPVYITFNRARQEDIRINAGEKGILVSYVGTNIKHKDTKERISEKEYKSLSKEEKAKYTVQTIRRITPVFNLDQTNIREARPELWEKNSIRINADIEARKNNRSFVYEPLENIVMNNQWIIPIKHSEQPRAYYSPGEQIIHLPKQSMFKSNEDYYSTALHEMAHSTEKPLNRNIANYGREELVAELTSAITGIQYNLPRHIEENSAKYLKSWLENMHADPSFLRTILEDVQKSSNFILTEVEKKYQIKNAVETEKNIGNSQKPLQEEKEKININYLNEITDFETRLIDNGFIKTKEIPLSHGKYCLTEEGIIGKNGDYEFAINFNKENNQISYFVFSNDPQYPERIGDYNNLKTCFSDIMSNFPLINNEKTDNIIGRINFYGSNGKVAETIEYSNKQDYLKAVAQEMEYNPNGFKHETLTTEPEVRKAIDDIIYNAHGVDNPHNIEWYVSKEAEREKRDEQSQKDQNSQQNSSENNVLSLLSMYAQVNLMTEAYMVAMNIKDDTLNNLVSEREKKIEENEQNSNAQQLHERYLLEDKIREHVATLVLSSKEISSLPAFPTAAQKEEMLKKYISTNTSGNIASELSVYIEKAQARDVSLQIVKPATPELISKLKQDGVDFIQTSHTVIYEAKVRYREGFNLENTPNNQASLRSMKIEASELPNGKLFISASDRNIGELLASDLKLSSIHGIGLLPKLQEEKLKEHLEKNQDLQPEDVNKLLNGEHIFKTSEHNPEEKQIHFIDWKLNQLRTISQSDVIIPDYVGSIRLSQENKEAILQGKEIEIFDQEQHIYHKLRLELNRTRNMEIDYKILKTAEYKPIPTVTSPDAEKKAYVAIKGANGIQDIWGRGGVNLERDSFLEKYGIQEKYREFIKLQKAGEPGTSIQQNEQIKNLIAEQERQTSRRLSR